MIEEACAEKDTEGKKNKRIDAYELMAFSAAGRSSKIVMAWPESENLTSADLSRATAAEMVANMRAERR
jgi:hypothetical protein